MKYGKPYAKDTLYRVWGTACEKAGVDYITIYQASRHSTASQIRQEKQLEAEQEVAKKLGHTNRSTARKHYILDDSREIK